MKRLDILFFYHMLFTLKKHKILHILINYILSCMQSTRCNNSSLFYRFIHIVYHGCLLLFKKNKYIIKIV